ncbi:hypothetical protein PPTG_24357 [Phytophthora nicotianae INRA-310]|uniref:Uncharacterized protein n=2 Tax=Phytophthora nicotianae TaxID=4792 RepID=W2PG97_PHYN3|nr:hypothetical protein PPTG_24357 [Phytophthora nicotianae INRA-310]ETM99886.1 hypothetical protein PPTG_24357 [Phytophthora nicotianae INRA-310]
MARAALEMASDRPHHHQVDRSASLSVTPQPASKADADSIFVDLLEFQAAWAQKQ